MSGSGAMRVLAGVVLLLFCGVALSEEEQFAPFTRVDFSTFVADHHRPLAECNRAYFSESGVHGAEIAKRIIEAGQYQAFLRDAGKVLGNDQIPAPVRATNPVGQVIATMRDLVFRSANDERLTIAQGVVPLVIANYYQSFATEGRCGAGQIFVDFIEKAKHADQ